MTPPTPTIAPLVMCPRPPPPALPHIEAAPSVVSRAVASGFADSGFATSSPCSIEELPPPQLLHAPVPVYRQHVRFAGAIEVPPSLPDGVVLASVAASPFPPLLVPRSPDVADTAMTLGDGRNTNAAGLGDSKHALLGIPESSLPSCFAPLPPTASSVTVDMLDALNDIVQGRSSPLSNSTSSSVEDIHTRRFHFEGAASYDNFRSVARDVQALGEGHNELLDAVSKMASHVISLERWYRRLEKRVDELEDADDVLTFGESALGPSPPADDSPFRNRRQRRRRDRSRKGSDTSYSSPPVRTAAVASAVPVAAPDPPPVPSATRPNTSGPAAYGPGS